MKHLLRMRWLALSLLMAGSMSVVCSAAEKQIAADERDGSAKRRLVTVNGEAITQGDVDLLMLSRGIPLDRRPQLQERMLEQLIDRRLITAFLKKQKAKVNQVELDAQVGRIKRRIRKRGDDPQQVLAKLGMTDEKLREELALSLAWVSHLRQVVDEAHLRKYFQKHRAEFDGTELRASLILLKVAADDDEATEKAIEELNQLRTEIIGGDITFAEAAKKFSEAPSRKAGGDVGFFAYRGKMPEAITRVVFGLKADEVSQPFVTRYGVHLATVTARKPGELSLEDARASIWKRLSQERWYETVQKQRAKAKIKRSTIKEKRKREL